ncbi:MAG TPA: hypothetical protein VLH56_19045 [Dissulfurispiraceae bacterium]|nr:hypothetical protein [Dissulfurispiraceae bacterium]
MTDHKVEEALALCDAASDNWSLGHQVNTADAKTEYFVYLEDQRVRWFGRYADCLFTAMARTLLPRALRALQEARKDTARLDLLERLISDGAEVCTEVYAGEGIVFIQKEDPLTCGPKYVYRGEGAAPLRSAIDNAKEAT